MRDYPLGNPDKNGEPLSRIRVLEDKNNDGRFETSTTFAERLLFVTGLQPWKGGVFVTLSGRLAYMESRGGVEGAEQKIIVRVTSPRLRASAWDHCCQVPLGAVILALAIR